jgi:diguanylate cyclase (GGDEF)-like protein
MREPMRPELTAKCLELIYSQSANANLASVGGGVLLGAMFWPRAEHAVVLGWGVAYLAMIWIRYRLALRFRGAPPGVDTSGRWLRAFRLAVGLSGVLWGAYAVYLATLANPMQLAVVALTVGALLSGAAIAYSVVFSAYLAFALPAVVPLGVFLVWRGGADATFLGVLLLIWTAFMSRSAHRFRDFALLSLGYQFENAQLVEQLNRLARTDALTGIANRRGFDEALAAAWARAAVDGGSVAVAVGDVDHFKAYNDAYGHPEGDACLRAVATAIARAADACGGLAARVGGEEFALLLPGGDTTRTTALAETMRAGLEAAAIPHCHAGARGVVTLSFGVAAAQARGGDAQALLAAADRALYAAKAAGRNRVDVADAADTVAG